MWGQGHLSNGDLRQDLQHFFTWWQSSTLPRGTEPTHDCYTCTVANCLLVYKMKVPLKRFIVIGWHSTLRSHCQLYSFRSCSSEVIQSNSSMSSLCPLNMDSFLGCPSWKRGQRSKTEWTYILNCPVPVQSVLTPNPNSSWTLALALLLLSLIFS